MKGANMNSMEPIKENRFLSLNSLSKNYGEQKVLSALSYSFYPKGLYLLFGENGSGKSTLLNILSGKETDYEGKISCSGEELSKKNRENPFLTIMSPMLHRMPFSSRIGR